MWWFDQPPERLWPLLADTPRFNEAMGLPKYQVGGNPPPRRHDAPHRTRHLGRYRLEWEEEPFQWAGTPRLHPDEAVPQAAPSQGWAPLWKLTPERGGSRVSYTLEAAPANPMGWLLLRLGFLDKVGAKTEKLIRDAAAHAADARTQPFDYTPPPSNPP